MICLNQPYSNSSLIKVHVGLGQGTGFRNVDVFPTGHACSVMPPGSLPLPAFGMRRGICLCQRHVLLGWASWANPTASWARRSSRGQKRSRTAAQAPGLPALHQPYWAPAQPLGSSLPSPPRGREDTVEGDKPQQAPDVCRYHNGSG